MKLMRSRNRWVKISERLPANREQVLCAARGKTCDTIYMYIDPEAEKDEEFRMDPLNYPPRQGMGFYDGPYKCHEPSHWMRLPDPPEE